MKDKRNISVLIPDGESEFALFVTHCLARSDNVKLYILSTESWPATRFSRYCHTFTHMPRPSADKTYLESIAEIVKKHNIDVLLPTETEWISFAVANKEVLSKFVAVVPLPDRETIKIANDKWLLAEYLSKHDIQYPPTIPVTGDDLFRERLSQLEFPVLLKPVTAWGGEGITRFDTLSELHAELHPQKIDQIKGKYIAQSFLPGRVVGVNVLARHGKLLAVTMQRGIIPNTQKYAAAGAIEFIQDNPFFEAVEKIVTTVRWNGFANLDMLHDGRDNQLKLLEINARFWGSLRGSLVAGVNFPYLACLAALDIPFPVPEYELVNYFHSKTAVREIIKNRLDKNAARKIAIKETGLKFLAIDFLAEVIRAFQQEILDRPSQ